MKFHLIFLICLSAQMFVFCQNSERAQKAMDNQKTPLTEALAKKGLKLGNPIFIRIFKESKELELWVKKADAKRYTLFKTYPICTYGEKGLGPKLKEGDKKAPEGFYFVKKSKLNPNSDYHLSFNLGYPNAYDEAHGRTGSALMVHGGCASIGCYAMTDPAIEEIYTMAYEALVNGDQPFFRVHCFPFRLTDENLEKHQEGDWYDFWKNLQEGYNYFEKNGVPPNVKVENKTYVFD